MLAIFIEVDFTPTLTNPQTFLFLQAHPDDLEFGCANLLKALADAGHRIIVVSLTRGEFGTTTENDDLKGPKLGRIRTQELLRAGRAHGVEKIEFLGAVDGFTKADRQTLQKLEGIIEKEQPIAVFSPEAFITYYWHQDHLNVGWLAYFATKHLRQRYGANAPKLFFYMTVRNEIHVPFFSTKHGLATMKAHVSQWWMMKWVSRVYGLLYRFVALRIPRVRYAEGFRRIRFHDRDFILHSPIEYFAINIGTIFFKMGGAFYNVHGQRPAFLDDLLAGQLYSPEEMSFNLRQPPEVAGDK
jgi:LmbE family N-acetylglucosaminyl deacetylase